MHIEKLSIGPRQYTSYLCETIKELLCLPTYVVLAMQVPIVLYNYVCMLPDIIVLYYDCYHV